MIAEKPDILGVVQAEGVELRRRGHRWWGLCPFHAEGTPSFVIDEDLQRWHCFGACGTGGDVLDFVQRLRGCDFKAAATYLGIGDGPAPSRAERRQREERRQLVGEFRQWQRLYHSRLCAWLRQLQRRKAEATTEADVFALAGDYHKEGAVLWQLDILESHDDESKVVLYEGVLKDGSLV